MINERKLVHFLLLWNSSYIWTAVVDNSEEWSSLLLSNCLNCKTNGDDHSSISSTTAVQIYELFHIYLTSEVSFIQEVSGAYTTPFLDTDELTSETISDRAECYAGLSVRFESSAACM